MACVKRNCADFFSCASNHRGALRNLVVGAVVALASGAAVALSVLGANQGSLVGVAISASLLPPAVNTVSIKYKTTTFMIST